MTHPITWLRGILTRNWLMSLHFILLLDLNRSRGNLNRLFLTLTEFKKKICINFRIFSFIDLTYKILNWNILLTINIRDDYFAKNVSKQKSLYFGKKVRISFNDEIASHTLRSLLFFITYAILRIRQVIIYVEMWWAVGGWKGGRGGGGRSRGCESCQYLLCHLHGNRVDPGLHPSLHPIEHLHLHIQLPSPGPAVFTVDDMVHVCTKRSLVISSLVHIF